MARYHYTRENENGVVLYLESEPAEDAMDEFDDEIAVGFRRWAEALDSGCADAIEKFIADWNGRADAGRWKHAAQADDNVWDNELK